MYQSTQSTARRYVQCPTVPQASHRHSADIIPSDIPSAPLQPSKSTIMNYCNKKLRITIKIRNEEMRHHVRKYIKISQAKRSSNAPGIQDSTSPHPGNDERHEMNESFGIPPSPYYSPVQFSSPPRVKPRPCTGFCEPLTPNP